ncbi:DUF5676 family membrane protein [Candidatus Nitrotoga sp. M5]|uniref:DUF5676 family membrane protein n=1 Tax=Candidatus Nitrotoga sp. M5 TaxID=2890409 RepID=UPI001EF6754C|nr:DUF5676 family membrane protein [Candidatus Nitrotoga sp. M5]CAH1387960.1 membrane hypothetical protein [Candidatus Nitrotoga sp. M5]
MPDLVKENTAEARHELRIRSRTSFRLPVIALGMSLGLFFAITFILCVSFDLLFPDQAMYKTWLGLLPGFAWLSWPSFFLGLGESFAYGWYVALIFGPLFNFFASLGQKGRS